jgi:SAM-dependent methyltransferase
MIGSSWTPFAHRYRQGEWRTPIFYDMVLRDTQQLHGEACVLDIGCGRGFDLAPDFQSRLRAMCRHYIGIEPDVGVPIADCFDEVHHCLFEQAPLPTAAVDIAYAVMVLEHVREPHRFWAKLWDVLRPGGVFWGFTVDARHYFAWISYWSERLGVKQRYLRLLHDRLGEEGCDHYPTPYLANSPRQISRWTQAFRRRDYISFKRVGQQDRYLPGCLKSAGRWIDRGLIAAGGPGSILAVRLER